MRALTVIASLVFAVSAFGQGRLSSMVGTLTDPDGRPVASATVQAREGAGALFKATTNARGEYVLNRLPSGTYALVVPAIGFSLDRFEQRDIAVGVAQVLRVDVRLQWGSNLGTPGDDQSVFNLRKYGTQRGAAPRGRDGKPDFSGVWIGNNDPDPEEPALLPWAAAAVQERIANQTRDHPSGFCLPSFPYPGGGLIFELVQTATRLVTIFETAPTYRKVYLDGRSHPKDPIRRGWDIRSADGSAIRWSSTPSVSTTGAGSRSFRTPRGST